MKIIFLDRDGVINKFPGMGHYVTSRRAFRFLPNAKKAIALLTRWGYTLYVVSNQGCVARGMITVEGLEEITRSMLRSVERAGGKIEKVFYCPHQTSDNCGCKKPKIKLFKQALKGKKISVGSIHFVGDSKEDMEAGKKLGCRTVLVLSGRTKQETIRELGVTPDFVKKDLWETARWITQKKS